MGEDLKGMKERIKSALWVGILAQVLCALPDLDISMILALGSVVVWKA